MKKKISQLVVTFFIVLFGAFFLLNLVYLLPTSPMKANMQESITEFMEEGENPFLLSGYKGSSLDNYTDAIMLQNAVYDSEKTFYKAAMLVERMSKHIDSPMEDLEAYLSEQEGLEPMEYSRYWHGYLVFLKPLLLIFNYQQIRVLNGVFSCGLFLFILLKLKQRNMLRGSVALLLAVFSLFPITIPYSLQFSSVFYVGMLSVLFFLWKEEFLEKVGWEVAFLVIGMCTSFMDFLTYPLFTFGMPLVIWCVLKPRKFLDLIKNGICWAVGYFGMWMSKWLIGSVITGKNMWISAMEATTFRLSETAYAEKFNRILAILRNFYIYFNVLGVLLFVIILTWIIYGSWKYRKELREKCSILFLFLVVALLPIAWYLVLGNHSYVHYWYTFRDLSVSIFALTMIPEVLYRNRKE